jgi:murein endopeptidase
MTMRPVLRRIRPAWFAYRDAHMCARGSQGCEPTAALPVSTGA